jgi:hypothetical protein
MYLYDSRCKKDLLPAAPETIPAETWAQWDKSFVSKGDSDEAKLNRRLNGFGRKDITLIGRFNSTIELNAPSMFGHMNCCRFEFLIFQVESVNNLDEQSGNFHGSIQTSLK